MTWWNRSFYFLLCLYVINVNVTSAPALPDVHVAFPIYVQHLFMRKLSV